MFLAAMILAVQSVNSTELTFGPGIYTLAEIGREAGIRPDRLKIERNVAHKRFAVYLPHSSWTDVAAKLDEAFGIKTTHESNSVTRFYQDSSSRAKELQVRKRILDAVGGAFEQQGQELIQNRPATWEEATNERQDLGEKILSPARLKVVTEPQIQNSQRDPNWSRWVSLSHLRRIGDWLASFAQSGDFEKVFKGKESVFNPFSAESAMKQFGLTSADLIPQCHLFRDEPLPSLSIGVAYGFDWRNLKLVCQPAVFGAKDWFEFGEAEETLVPTNALRLDSDLRSVFPTLRLLGAELLDRSAKVTLAPGRYGQSEALLMWANAIRQPLLADFSLTSDREGSIEVPNGTSDVTLRRILAAYEDVVARPESSRDQRNRLMELIQRPEASVLSKSIANRIFRRTETSYVGNCLVVRHSGMPLVEWLDPDPTPLFRANGSAKDPIKSPWLHGIQAIRAFARELPNKQLGDWSPLYSGIGPDDMDALSSLLPALSWLRLLEDRSPSEAAQFWTDAIKTGEASVPLSQLASTDRLIETLNELSALSISGTFGYSRAWQNGVAEADIILHVLKNPDSSPKAIHLVIQNRNIPWQGVRFDIDLG